MTDYRDLSDKEKEEVCHKVRFGAVTNEDFAWDRQTVDRIKSGFSCAYCFMVSYNCLCSHDD